MCPLDSHKRPEPASQSHSHALAWWQLQARLHACQRLPLIWARTSSSLRPAFPCASPPEPCTLLRGVAADLRVTYRLVTRMRGPLPDYCCEEAAPGLEDIIMI